MVCVSMFKKNVIAAVYDAFLIDNYEAWKTIYNQA